MRSAIFDRLQGEVVGARVLDLFAGSGALAIEALSRGAREATLVERQGELVRFLGRQLEALGLRDRTRVVRSDARRFLAPGPDGPAFDLVLVDPPYAEIGLYDQVLSALLDGGWLAPAAVVVVEYHRHRGQRPAIAVPAALRCEAIRNHGHTALEFLRCPPAVDPRPADSPPDLPEHPPEHPEQQP